MNRKLILPAALVLLLVALFSGSAQARNLSRLVAPASACANQTDLGDPIAVQIQSMRCMTNYARAKDGLGDLGKAADLDRSAGRKNADMIHCDSFSHYACGHDFTYWMQRSGYLSARCWRAGENIAWGTGTSASVRSIFIAWLHSPEHRANLLGRYSEVGISMTVGRLGGNGEAHLWTQDFGSHCGGAPAVPRTAVPTHLGSRVRYAAH